MSQIFISYRREDSAYATGPINERLSKQFGKDAVFSDVDSIPLGVDFQEYIDEHVAQCDVLLAVIGEKWLTVTDDKGNPRLGNPDDFVRLEIKTALDRKIPVIPVLTDGVKMPLRSELPEDIAPLSTRNATIIRPMPGFNADVDRLVKGIEEHSKRTGRHYAIWWSLPIIITIGLVAYMLNVDLMNRGKTIEVVSVINDADLDRSGKLEVERIAKEQEWQRYKPMGGNDKAIGHNQKCVNGDAEGCNNLGVMYYDGEGVAKDARKAVELNKKTCDFNDDERGCSNLGGIHNRGNGVEIDKDYKKPPEKVYSKPSKIVYRKPPRKEYMKPEKKAYVRP